MDKSNYIIGLRDLKKSFVIFGKSKHDTYTKRDMWKDYYQRVLKLGVDKKFIDNKTRLKLNRNNKQMGGIAALSGKDNTISVMIQGIDIILNNTMKENINEKAVSKNQQQFMGMVHGIQKGEIDPNDVSADVKNAADSMKEKDVKDFASTSHKGLPTRVKNEIIRKLKEYGTVDDRHHQPDSKDENFPVAWLQGRGGNANKAKIYDKDRDYDDTNFRKKHSGQNDIGEGNSISPQGYVPRNKENKSGFVDNATSATAWLLGREGRKFQKATYDREGTYDGQNFVVKNSGQTDIEEHHNGEFPQQVLDQTVGEFLDILKLKNTKYYNHVEDIIEKYFVDDLEETVHTTSLKHYKKLKATGVDVKLVTKQDLNEVIGEPIESKGNSYYIGNTDGNKYVFVFHDKPLGKPVKIDGKALLIKVVDIDYKLK